MLLLSLESLLPYLLVAVEQSGSVCYYIQEIHNSGVSVYNSHTECGIINSSYTIGLPQYATD